MLYYLIIILSCSSLAISPAERKGIICDASNQIANTNQQMPTMNPDQANPLSRLETRRRESIQKLLKMRHGQSQQRTESYFIRNDNGNIYERKTNQTTGLFEERRFTPDDVAHVSFSDSSEAIEITLKK